MKNFFNNIYVQFALVIIITPLIGVLYFFMINDTGRTECKRLANVHRVEFYKYDFSTGVCLIRYKGKVMDVNKIVYKFDIN